MKTELVSSGTMHFNDGLEGSNVFALRQTCVERVFRVSKVETRFFFCSFGERLFFSLVTTDADELAVDSAVVNDEDGFVGVDTIYMRVVAAAEKDADGDNDDEMCRKQQI